MSVLSSLVVAVVASAVCATAEQRAAVGEFDPAQGSWPRSRTASEQVLLQQNVTASIVGGRRMADTANGKVEEDVASGEVEDCHDVLEGEPCYPHVHWAWTRGIFDYPSMYVGLTTASSFEDFQAFIHDTQPELCPKPCSTDAIPPAGEACVSRAVSLNFTGSMLSQNNLGGGGPDTDCREMRYKHIGRSGGQPFDLVVVATGPYQRTRKSQNGLVAGGNYGIFNVKSGTSVELTFSFENTSSGEPVVLDAFHFSFLDIDQSRTVKEHMYFDGFERYTLSDPTDVAVDFDGQGRTVFSSTQMGYGCDNPKNPLDLGEVTCRGRTVDQRRRAVTLLFSNTSSFSTRVEASCERGACVSGGRNILFAGSSTLAASCEESPRLGLCTAFGDPHFVTFDGAHTVIMEERVIWLVYSADVWIQALSKGSAGNFQGLAIGGTFIEDSTLLVVKDTAHTLRASFDGEDILSDASGEFVVPGIVEGYRSETWNATLHNKDILKVRTQLQFSVGPWPERFVQQPIGGLLLFKLPGGVEVTVTGADWMSVVITMPKQQGGQGGYCGDFDGEVHNDFEPRHNSFHKPAGAHLEAVEASQVLFDPEWLASQTPQAIDASQLDPETVVQQCHPALKKTAEERCQQVTERRLRDDCIFDVCATGLISAADGILSAEMLEEKVNSRGIPLFRGDGRCLDSAGDDYVAFGTSLATREECTDVLRSLALTPGIMGAQIYKDSVCQILAQNGTDPTQVHILGGWGPKVQQSGHGIGMVSDTDGEQDWACWQLV